MDNPRYLAVKLLNKTFRNKSYSNIQLSSGLDASGMSDRDKRLCSIIYYGVIERRITLDYIISQFSSRSISQMNEAVVNILRCGLYQLIYMDSIPDRAAVNESVNLAEKFGKAGASGYINAVLRNFIRTGKKCKMPDDEKMAVSVEYSAPIWLVESLSADYGKELMIDLLSDALERPPITVRMNNLKCSKEEFIAALGDIDTEEKPEIPGCYNLSGTSAPMKTDAFEAGYFHVQDAASQLCCMALGAAEDDNVLDICAAPGGKTFTIAEMISGEGHIYAGDLHEKRVNLIRSGADRLGLNNIKTFCGDASVFNPELPKFSKILCDVPCSGIGAIRRKPEIKYKNPEDFSRLPEIQYKIAENALNYLETGGEMVYSTCTLRRAENDEVIEKLLKNHSELEPVNLPEFMYESSRSYKASIFPHCFGSDGFFISKVKKIR